MSVQRIRPLWGQFWRRWIVQVSVAQIILAAILLIAADTIYDQLGNSLFAGIFDEVAHVSTALLMLNLLPDRWRRPILPQALVASFLIDIDHVPQYLFHARFLTEGTPRPYTHSLMTPAVFLLIALIWPRSRTMCVGIAVGLLLHFFRDLAEGLGSGMSLLWPFSDHAFSYRHTLYLELMAVIVLLNLLKLAVQGDLSLMPATRSTEP